MLLTAAVLNGTGPYFNDVSPSDVSSVLKLARSCASVDHLTAKTDSTLLSQAKPLSLLFMAQMAQHATTYINKSGTTRNLTATKNTN